MRDASICGLGQTAANAVESAIANLGVFAMTVTRSDAEAHDRADRRRQACASRGPTILDACRRSAIDTPTLCYLDTLTPVNVCRVCVVEVEGARALVPACSRKAEAGMVVHTDSERVRHTAGSCSSCSARRSISRPRPTRSRYIEQYDAKPERFGPDAATVAQPVKIDNDLYVRDYAKCILCYKCVEACGVDHQNTFAIAVAGRGFDAHISTEFDVALPDSACVYCGNCIAVCPTGALMSKSEYEMRQAGTWDESQQTRSDDDLPVLRRRLQARRCTCRTTRSSRSRRPTTTTSRAATSASRAASAIEFVEPLAIEQRPQVVLHLVEAVFLAVVLGHVVTAGLVAERQLRSSASSRRPFRADPPTRRPPHPATLRTATSATVRVGGSTSR